MKRSDRGRLAAFLLSLLLAVTLLGAALPAAAAEASGSDLTSPAGDILPSEEGDGAAKDKETATPLSALFADFLSENAATLLSGATFALTMLATLVFRKKIVPGLLEALSGLLGKSRETIDAIEEGRVTERAEIDRLLSRAEEMLDAAKEAATKAETAAEGLLARGTVDAEVRLILGEQEALLYELLMSANLPQYEKERIGKAHAEAQRALAETRHA